MDTIYTINMTAGILMAALCFAVLAMTTQHQGMAHIRAFLLFWAVTALLGVLDRIWRNSWEFYVSHQSLQFALDAISNMTVVIAAYALYRGSRFAWNDRNLHAMYSAIPVLFCIELMFGFLAEQEKTLVWQLFYATPGAFMATVSLMFVGVAVFREPLVAGFRWPLVILFALYAYLQIPAYVCDYIEVEGMKEQVEHGRKIILGFLAATKFGLALSLAVIVMTQKGEGAAQRNASSARLSLSILSGALTLVVFFYRFAQLRGFMGLPSSP